MKEMLDIVDVHDNITSTGSRKDIHETNSLHRLVVIIIFNDKGEVLVQKRGKHVDRYPSFKEASLSGHVQEGESYQDTAIRELKEEFGVSLTPKHFDSIIKFGFHDDEERAWVELFAVRDFKEDVKIDGEEVQSSEWLSWDELTNQAKPENFFTPICIKAIEQFKGLRLKDYIEAR